MGFFNFKQNKKEKNQSSIKDEEIVKKVFANEVQAKVTFKNYAIELCINRLANAIALCDFETYEKGKYKKTPLWYQLNVEPNQNQNAPDFWNKAINQMVYNSEGALIIQSDDHQLLVADSFNVETFALKPNRYTYVTIEDFTYQRTFYENQVLRFKLNNSKIKDLIDSVYEDYGTLLAGAIRNYNRSNSVKYLVKINALFDQYKDVFVDKGGEEEEEEKEEEEEVETEYDAILDELFENRFKSLFSEKDAAIPLEEGLELDDMNSSGSKSGGSAANKTTRDIAAMFEDILNMAADAFGIPRGLLKGDVADADVMTDNMISFGVNPLARVFQSETNRKFYGQEKVIAGCHCKVRTERIRNYDITKLATSAELTARIGAFSINGILRILNEEPINEPWAEMHVISKNYALVEELLKGGGENAGETESNRG